MQIQRTPHGFDCKAATTWLRPWSCAKIECLAADDEDHACVLADRYMFHDAISAAPDDSLLVDVLKEIKHVDELIKYDWDGKCIPYGDTDGNTRIEEILK